MKPDRGSLAAINAGSYSIISHLSMSSPHCGSGLDLNYSHPPAATRGGTFGMAKARYRQCEEPPTLFLFPVNRLNEDFIINHLKNERHFVPGEVDRCGLEIFELMTTGLEKWCEQRG
jgi:hypothetical protein